MEQLKRWVDELVSPIRTGDARNQYAAAGGDADAEAGADERRAAALLAKQQEAARAAATPKPDGGYGWLIVLSSFVLHVIIYGQTWSVGVFNVIFLEEFKQSKTSTAWVGSIINALMYATGLASSALVDRFGCRPVVIAGGVVASAGVALSALAHQLWVLYLTFSLLGGIGLGIAYMPTIIIVSEYFDQRRTIALGLAVSGVGFGSFIFPALIRSLMRVHSWRTTMAILAAIMFASITFFGALMKPLPRANSFNSNVCKYQNSAKKTTYLRDLRANVGIIRSVPFLVLCANNLLYCFGLVIVYVHLGSLGISSGLFSAENHGMLFSIVGVSNLVGRVLHGVVCHFPRMTTILVYMFSSVASGIATLVMPISSSVTALCVCAATFGFCSSCLGALLPDIIIRLVGERRLGAGYGLLLLFEGAGSIVGGPVAGFLFDATQVYDHSFYLSGSLLIGAGLVMVVPWRYTSTCRHADDVSEAGDPHTAERSLAKAEEAAAGPSLAENLLEDDSDHADSSPVAV